MLLFLSEERHLSVGHENKHLKKNYNLTVDLCVFHGFILSSHCCHSDHNLIPPAELHGGKSQPVNHIYRSLYKWNPEGSTQFALRFKNWVRLATFQRVSHLYAKLTPAQELRTQLMMDCSMITNDGRKITIICTRLITLVGFKQVLAWPNFSRHSLWGKLATKQKRNLQNKNKKKPNNNITFCYMASFRYHRN